MTELAAVTSCYSLTCFSTFKYIILETVWNNQKNYILSILHFIPLLLDNKSQTHQGTVQCSLCCTVDEHTASCCAHGQQVCLLLHLPCLRFPLLPLRPLLKHSTFVMLNYLNITNNDISMRHAWGRHSFTCTKIYLISLKSITQLIN